MKILVISDSHGDSFYYRDVLLREKVAEIVFHLGDGERETDNFLYEYPEKKLFQVRGNCDFGSKAPVSIDTVLSGKRFLATHGFAQQVKYSLTTLSFQAREIKADICLFGHTHLPLLSWDYGIMFMNPGSLADGRYGIIEITANGEVKADLKRL